jgi:hypothetical protein
MNSLHTTSQRIAHLLAKASEIGRQNGWGNFDHGFNR